MVGIFVLCLVHVLHHKEQLTEVEIIFEFDSILMWGHVSGDHHCDHGDHVHHISGLPPHLWADRVSHSASCQGENH